MEKKNIAGMLQCAAEMVAGWEKDSVPEIEKDSVLASLREVYTAIKYGATDDAVRECPQGKPIPTEDIPLQAEDNSCPEQAPRTYVMEAMAPAPPAENYTVEITEVPAPEDIPGEESSFIANSEDEKQEFERNILFDESEIPVKPKLDRRAILSLYGDEHAPAAPATETSAPMELRDEAPSHIPAEPTAQPQAPAYVPLQPEPQPMAAEAEPVAVLGDVLGNGNRTVSDFYAGQTDTTDVASVVGSGRVASLRQAIGINDKFLLVRNLFEGNAEVCESVIDTLDGFTDLDDALIYIHENFNWNPDNEAVKMLVDVLTRKLS